MTKALLKKQMMEAFSWVYQNKKTRKKRSPLGVAGYALLYLLIFGFLGVVFYMVASMLCEPLASVGLGWLYWAIMGLLGLFMGVFGSVFNTYSSLYNAGDNDLLLSMPVPAGKILTARLSGVYALGLMYELIIMLPALIVWFLTVQVKPLGAVFSLLIPLVLSVLVLVLSAVLGWVVALVSSRLKNKNIVTVFLSLVFIGAYYYCYTHAYSLLQSILADPATAGDRVRSILYPLYHMGLAAEGSILSMLAFTAVTGVLLALTYLVLSRSFLKIATANRGSAKVKYREQQAVVHPAGQALYQKELRRFLGSASYMLNCGLGIIFMIVAAAALIWKSDVVREMMLTLFGEQNGVTALMAVAGICMISSMNDMTAPSVSLEGKNIWLLQVFPVTGRQVLMAKLRLHLTLTLVPAAVLTAAVEWVLRPELAYAFAIPVAAGLYILFMAALGLAVNLKMPNLTWTSETVPIKQSAGVMIALFGGWAVVIAMGFVYYLVSAFMSPFVFLICAAGCLLAGFLLLLGWLRTRGARSFETL